MAYLSPTMLAKPAAVGRAMALGGAVHSFRLLSLPRCGGALEAIVDRLTQAVVRYLHYRDAPDTGSVQRAEMGEEVSRRFDQVAARRQIEHCAGSRRRAKGEQRFPRLRSIGIKTQRGLWRVMRRHHARCHRRFVGDWRYRERAAENAFDRFAWNAAGAQQCRPLETRIRSMIELDTDGARSGIDDQIDAPPQVGQHMSSAGWRNVARTVRGWRHHGPAERREQVTRDQDAPARAPRHCRRPASARSATPQSGCLANTNVSGPRPEIRREFFSRRIENTNAPGRGDIRNMCDQRVE